MLFEFFFSQSHIASIAWVNLDFGKASGFIAKSIQPLFECTTGSHRSKSIRPIRCWHFDAVVCGDTRLNEIIE